MVFRGILSRRVKQQLPHCNAETNEGRWRTGWQDAINMEEVRQNELADRRDPRELIEVVNFAN